MRNSWINAQIVNAFADMSNIVHENWRRVQQETLVNWMNSYLKCFHSIELSNIETDLKDGSFLSLLLNALVMKYSEGKHIKVTVRNSNPVLSEQMRENLTAIFEFMKKENIKLVNIGKNCSGSLYIYT